MARVPNTESISHLIGGDEVVLPPATGPEAKRVLADIDRQVAEIERKLMAKAQQ
ncbi:hypothetical protein [Devosia sp. RR2S18]|uniref:hypothetical protein n=1 Tax=Devosia rhizosphaerae TaxID=3049774 RepID=UPI0025414656|nr:hypothetical protein [Devosia sp. RR2S18]WIJ26589.1 hypothetical protein QOV41_07515 [Devosia sp. RR2S18]